MSMLIVNGTKSFNDKEKNVLDINASILNRGNRNYWYVRYQVFFKNGNVKKGETSTHVLKSEQNLKYMKSKYLPAWIAKELEKLKVATKTKKVFSYYLEKFLTIHESDKSFNNRIGVYNRVNKFFGDKVLTEIKTLTVKEYLASLNLRNSSKRDYLACIKGTLDIALDDEAIDRNVAFGIRFKREEKSPINVFSIDEISLLLNKSDGMFRNYIGIALNTGMRSGEILGLMHSDILEDRITVKRSVSKGRITSPKTLRSVRDIPMLDSVRPFIESQKKLSNSLYLFEYDGAFIKDASYFKRRWHQLIKDCGIEYRKLYSTRHTFITAMLNSEKYKIMDIAAIVGHTSPEMIMKNYAGFIKGNHLKVDTSTDLYNDTKELFGGTLGGTNDFKKLKKV